jgi:putative N-acetylmannosamine-6-phosphate epimerase
MRPRYVTATGRTLNYLDEPVLADLAALLRADADVIAQDAAIRDRLAR